MPPRNVEVVRRALDAWNRRDLDGALEWMHADGEVDWCESRGPQKGIYRGLLEIRCFYEDWLSLFDKVDIRPEEFVAAGQHVVVPNRGYARGREGVTVEASSTQVFTISEGKIARIRLYQDKGAALKAVGLPE
jgi:ketosteroid isomerase-like protein